MAKKKIYPPDIRELREIKRGHVGYYSQGLHAPLAFVAAIAAMDLPRRIAIDSRAIRHEWRRCVPVPGEHFTELQRARPGVPGAFPVTVVEDV